MTTPEQQGGERPPVEIERKFLVTSLPENLDSYHHESIKQGYLVIAEDGTEARIRDRDGAYTFTLKSKGGLVRGEVEDQVDEEFFNKFWPATEGKRVEKTRYSVPYGAALIELDIYEGKLAGLVTAEVEFTDEALAQSFAPPEWFGQDVTEDKAFKNQQLATSNAVS